jgi:hypothetical protein
MTLMDRKTARKYRDWDPAKRFQPSSRPYRTRLDPFADVWPEVEVKRQQAPALKAYTLFEWLQQHPGRFPDSTRRTFERRVSQWRALAERYERGSVLLTSNLPFSKWDQIFKDPMTTAAAIDRLVHHSVIIEMNVDSYRLQAAKKNKSTPAKTPCVNWHFK